MAYHRMTIWDGKHVRKTDTSLPAFIVNINGAQLLKLADDRVSYSALLDLPLPKSVKSAALHRIRVNDVVALHARPLNHSEASYLLRIYIAAIADELDDYPIGVVISDGGDIQDCLDHDFAEVGQGIFNELDTENQGKIIKDQIRNALVNLCIETIDGEQYPQVEDIVKKHGAEGNEEVEVAEFVHLLQSVLQELADSLAENPVVTLEDVTIYNGSDIRKLLADEREFDNVLRMTMMEKYAKKDKPWWVCKVRHFLKQHEEDFGLPPSELFDQMDNYYMQIFTDLRAIEDDNDGDKSGNDEFDVMLKDVLEKFSAMLKQDPVIHYFDAD